MSPKLKICGMKHNTAQVAALQPDYLGFIFYEKSPRNFDFETTASTGKAKRVGVFVNASMEFIIAKAIQFQLEVIQLHGDESPHYCAQLKTEIHLERNKWVTVNLEREYPAIPPEAELWKVFSIKDTFDFETLTPYEPIVDKFLFDTKGKEKGGNGFTFNWSVLRDYPSQKPFVLSGGIGLEEMDAVRLLMQTELPLYAIDVNSRFELEPGLKDISALKKLNHELQR